jgi:hypothetical protein
MVKPKLLKLDWFAKAWIRFVALRRRTVWGFKSWFRSRFRSWKAREPRSD